MKSLRRAVARAISDTVGTGVAGRVVRQAADATIVQKERSTSFSKAEVQAAIVSAFQSVQSRFQWNGAEATWVGVSEPTTAFAKRLAEAPVTERFDQGVLARALVELSAADGEVSDDERSFMADFLDPSLGTVDELAQRPPLTAADLGETTESVRGSILLLGWACAMSDEDLADAEVDRLGELAAGLGIDTDQAADLRRDAQQFLFDQTLDSVYASGSRDTDGFALALEAATKMGIDQAAVEKFDAAYRKRCGIV